MRGRKRRLPENFVPPEWVTSDDEDQLQLQGQQQQEHAYLQGEHEQPQGGQVQLPQEDVFFDSDDDYYFEPMDEEDQLIDGGQLQEDVNHIEEVQHLQGEHVGDDHEQDPGDPGDDRPVNEPIEPIEGNYIFNINNDILFVTLYP